MQVCNLHSRRITQFLHDRLAVSSNLVKFFQMQSFMKNILKILSILCLLFLACQEEKEQTRLNLIPYPQEVNLNSGTISLKKGFFCVVKNQSLLGVIPVLEEEFFLLTGFELELIEKNEKVPTLTLQLDESLQPEEYNLIVDENIILSGGSYNAIAMGTSTLLQMMDEEQVLPKGNIKDAPKSEYRSLMIDCARGWHPIENLKQIITMSRWYKIRYLHLHLTDDQLFTFQSEKYPALATEEQSYTKEELKELNQYASDRGVILIPEIDVPAHASQFIKKMPEVFGIGDTEKNYYTMSMGKEKTYQALDDLFGELAEIFQASPYIHIGGDEAHFDGMAEDPETIAYMAKHNIPSVDELFRHFIVRMNESVKRRGKQTLAWAGFSRKGGIEIPKDIIVLSWESQYYDPQLLLDDGYAVVNASFKPLYIVNNRKWSTEYIYTKWNLGRWENGVNFSKNFEGLEVKNTKGIMGGTMCSWEQSALVEIRRARKRLAAFSEILWGTNQEEYSNVENRLKVTDRKLQKLFHPFEISEKGLLLAKEKESNFYEHLWFDSSLEFNAEPRYNSIELRYSNNNKPIDQTAKVFQKPIQFSDNATIKIQAFQKNGKAIGHPFYNKYYYKPLKAIKTGLEIERLASSWERLRFTNQLKIELKSPREDFQIKYKTQGTDFKPYGSPIMVTETTHLSAQLYDAEDNKIGSALNETYYLLKEKSCLTTGKKTIASNEKLRPKMAEIATNGRVSLWEHWSDQTNGGNWIMVDLEKEETISKFLVHCFWDNYRYYQYTIEVSSDGKSWKQVVDYSKNKELSSIDGYTHDIEKQNARYLRLNVLHNSANPGLHITEFCAF